VRQRFVRLDCQDLTVDSAPVCAKIETVTHDRLATTSGPSPAGFGGTLKDDSQAFRANGKAIKKRAGLWHPADKSQFGCGGLQRTQDTHLPL